jgi:hypothetical protein
MQGQWLLGAPATHAFLIVEHSDGMRWRFDAVGTLPPFDGARWSPCYTWDEIEHPCMIWELLVDPLTAARVAERARQADGEPYNWDQIARQAAVGVATMFRRLPLLSQFADVIGNLGSKTWLHHAAICTALTRECLTPADVTVAELRDMSDLLPEREGRVFWRAEGRWTRLVYRRMT